ncbi:hypothetical protein ABLG96_11115 [Nakamurella sp. A5-74]|uniref:Uncharacterized protein n=1 Tax=Nakamurella sp. A5-74 TaxID=3158264 RepID=A0AAU8DJI1_9ACTN
MSAPGSSAVPEGSRADNGVPDRALPTRPFEEPTLLEGEVLDGPAGFGGAGGRAGVFGLFTTLSSLSGGRDVRQLLTTPLRWLAILVLIPSLVSGLLGFAIDSGGGRVLAFVIAVIGVVVAGMLEFRRRAIVGPERVSTTRTTPLTSIPKVSGLLGLVLLSLITMAVAMGFDLLALLLLLFGAW